MPADILPEDCGLIVADPFGAAIIRDARHHPLAGARRKAVTLRFAHSAASALHAWPIPARFRTVGSRSINAARAWPGCAAACGGAC